MIAANFKKWPSAMALQMCLPFGKPVWQLPRPTTRLLRQIRAARAKAFKTAGFIRYPQKATMPQWIKDARKMAKELAWTIELACMDLFYMN